MVHDSRRASASIPAPVPADGAVARTVRGAAPTVDSPSSARAPSGTNDHEPHWLPRRRLALPPPPVHYYERAALTRRCVPAEQQVTILMAPGGFGKTTLLAEGCRRAEAQGVRSAWITLAPEDDAATLDVHLAFAFHTSGVDLLGHNRADDAFGHAAYPRTDLVLHALGASRQPHIVAFDELENATDSTAIELLNHFLRNAPPCLHIAIACRELPPGLDASRAVLGGRAEIIAATDLRFDKADIARYFDLKLSSRELAAIASESDGWPIALTIRRNSDGRRRDAETHVARHVVDNWIAGRFWEGFSTADREMVLDAGLLDWIDSELLEEILDEPGVFDRLRAIPRLVGLLQPAGGRAEIYRLHPLLRQHCIERQRRETPARYRRIQRRIAQALARRGETIEAMRHATLAEDPEFAGAILLDAGAVRLWLREGTDRLAAAHRYVTDQVATLPRLAMSRCIAHLIQGRLRDARRVFATAPAELDESDYMVDRYLVLGAMDVTGCRPLTKTEARALANPIKQLVDLTSVSTLLRAGLLYGQSVQYAGRAEFDTSVAVAHRARRLAVNRSAYLTMIVDTQLGEIAMARGRVSEAQGRYRAAQRLAREHFLNDPRMGVPVGLLRFELAHERNRASNADPRRITSEPYRGDTPRSHYVAAADIVSDIAFADGDADAALSAIEILVDRAHEAGLDALDQHFAALRVGVLADGGRVEEAQRAWCAAELPSSVSGCLRFDIRSWRETEALVCARLRLLAATGDTAAGLHLERELAAVAVERNLRRTQMRGLALRIRLLHAAGDEDAVYGAARDFLAMYLRTDYARPILRAGPAAQTALARVADVERDVNLAAAAERILAMSPDRVSAPRLNHREMAVLRLLGSASDKRIAAHLELTVDGVRYRIRRIFAKLGVRRRGDAVRRAVAVGLLDDAVQDGLESRENE